ncbi:MAG: thioesterase family protein [Pirellulaceae bacterium]|nr:thioesterase family protein [Pirellulaceae bacterium]
MPAPFRTTRRVEFCDTDAAGIAHFAAFFRYLEQAEHELLRSVGLSVHDHATGIGWPRVSAKCDYRAPARFEEVLDIAVTIARLGEKSVTYAATFTRGGQLIASGEITSVCCRVGDGGLPESIPIPETFRAKLQGLASGG